jgi:hypothetical protein
MNDKKEKQSGKPINISDELARVVDKYSQAYEPMNRVGKLWARDETVNRNETGNREKGSGFHQQVRSSNFDSSHLKKIVEEIKRIEERLKTIVAARTKKIVEEKVPVEKQRPAKYGFIRKALLSLGLIRQKMETYTDFELIKKEKPRKPDEVDISEFRTMIDRYIENLKSLNQGLHGTVLEVDRIVQNLTFVSDSYTDQIHHDRKAYHKQIQKSRDLESRLEEVATLHDSLSPLNDRFPEVEKARDHLEMALRDSQGQEFKYKTNIDMGSNYQTALKSYRRLINDFRERGELHVNMVEKFVEGAGHMKIAVDNVSQICSGVAKVTQSMIMIVDSIEGGNKVLGRYAALIGERAAGEKQWDMDYKELREAEDVYLANDKDRLKRLESNRSELEALTG